MDTWFLIKKPEINTREKTASSTNGAVKLDSACRRIQIGTYPAPCTKRQKNQKLQHKARYPESDRRESGEKA